MERPLAALAALAAALLGASAALCVAAPAARTSPSAAAADATRPRPADSARAARPPPAYRVELIVFRATSAFGAPEDWAAEAGTGPVTSSDADPGVAEPSGAQTAGGQAAGAAPGAAQAGSTAPEGVVRILTSSEFELDSVAARLHASGRYVPVAHIAWVQTASPWGKPLQIPLQSLGLDAQGITGTVALERGVYLHLALDLRYAMNDPPAGLGAQPGTVFVLDESHRVRLKERNYFDHPAFGVIALVTSDQPAARPRG